MSGGQKRRFGRGGRAASGPPVTIEREKIRRPQSSDLASDLANDAAGDLVFDEQTMPPQRSSYRADAGDRGFVQHPQDEAFEPDDMGDWRGAEQVEEVWDEENEEDWTLVDDDRHGPSDYDEEAYAADGYSEEGYGEDDYRGEEDDEGGIVWEDNDFAGPGAIEDPQEVAFGRQNRPLESAPEVELAGRRDVRPKPPRPPGAPAPRPAAPQSQPRPKSQPRPQRPPPDDQSGFAPPPPVFSNPRPPAPAAPSARLDTGRAGLALDDEDDEVLQQPMQGQVQRRRQAHPPPPKLAAKPPRAAARRRKGGIGTASTLLILALLAGAGWFGYQAISRTGLQPIIDRLSTILPLPSSTRGAGDTSFADAGGADAGTGDTASAEQALSDLERRIQQQEGGDVAAPSSSDQTGSSQPASGADDPPVPALKPIPGAAGSSSLDDERQVAVNGDGNGGGNGGEDEGDEPSLLQQILRYINPG